MSFSPVLMQMGRAVTGRRKGKEIKAVLAEDVTTLRIGEDAASEAAARPYLAQARVSSGRLEDLLALYASDAIRVPTMEGEVGGHADGRRACFESFLANHKLRCHIDSLRKRISHKLRTELPSAEHSR